MSTPGPLVANRRLRKKDKGEKKRSVAARRGRMRTVPIKERQKSRGHSETLRSRHGGIQGGTPGESQGAEGETTERSMKRTTTIATEIAIVIEIEIETAITIIGRSAMT